MGDYVRPFVVSLCLNNPDLLAPWGRYDDLIIWLAYSKDWKSVSAVLDVAPWQASVSKRGKTALHYAAVHGNVDIARRLLESGASPLAPDLTYNTPMHDGAWNASIVRLFLDHDPKAAFVVDPEGHLPLHRACCKRAEPDAVELLAAANPGGAKRYAKHDRTPLHYALLARRLDVMGVLVRVVGADLTIGTCFSVLNMAVVSLNWAPGVRFLLGHVADNVSKAQAAELAMAGLRAVHMVKRGYVCRDASYRKVTWALMETMLLYGSFVESGKGHCLLTRSQRAFLCAIRRLERCDALPTLLPDLKRKILALSL